MADQNTSVGQTKPGAFLSERHRNPAELMAQQGKKDGHAFAGVCAILATLVFVAMVMLLWADWTALRAA